MADIIIPRVFHQIWLGSKPMPDEFEDYGKSWVENNPLWQLVLWNDSNMIPLTNQKIYDSLNSLPQKSDVARYEILYRYGGVYVDCDFRCLKSIEELLPGVEAFAASEGPGIISNGIIGCVPHNEIMGKVISELESSFDKHIKSRPSYQTGPMYLTRIVKKENKFTVFGPELFYPYSYNEKHRRNETFPNAYAVHYW
ncbi:MAG: glycosyltransferase [Syntrophomonadaceae bacterium]